MGCKILKINNKVSEIFAIIYKSCHNKYCDSFFMLDNRFYKDKEGSN